MSLAGIRLSLSSSMVVIGAAAAFLPGVSHARPAPPPSFTKPPIIVTTPAAPPPRPSAFSAGINSGNLSVGAASLRTVPTSAMSRPSFTGTTDPL